MSLESEAIGNASAAPALQLDDVEFARPGPDGWALFNFNYNGSATPALNKVVTLSNVGLSFSLHDHFISYKASSTYQVVNAPGTIRYHRELLLLVLSTTNSAHSLCELLSFLTFYKSLDNAPMVAVNSHIVSGLPFLYQLFSKVIPSDKHIILDSARVYLVDRLVLRRNNHFNYVTNWTAIPFVESGDDLRFFGLQNKLSFLDDPDILYRITRSVATAPDQQYPTYDSVMLIKTKDDPGLTTPGRAMTLVPEVRGAVEALGVKVISINNFSNIDEYLSVMYSAKTLITSYGGAACTNRFFVNPECKVILIGNRSYSFEYRYASDEPYWHLRHSHLFPVREQVVLLDRPDVIDLGQVSELRRYL